MELREIRTPNTPLAQGLCVDELILGQPLYVIYDYYRHPHGRVLSNAIRLAIQMESTKEPASSYDDERTRLLDAVHDLLQIPYYGDDEAWPGEEDVSESDDGGDDDEFDYDKEPSRKLASPPAPAPTPLSKKPRKRVPSLRWNPRKVRKVGRKNMKALNAKRQRSHDEVLPECTPASRWAFSLFVAGGSWHQSFIFSSYVGYTAPVERTYYRYQTPMAKRIIAYSKSLVRRRREMMGYDTVVRFDGSWGHPRRSYQCVGSFISCQTKKIIRYKAINQYHGDETGNAYTASSMLENKIFLHLVEKSRTDPRIKGIVHDQDAKSSKAIAEADWQVANWFDKNHVVKGFNTAYRRWAFVERKGDDPLDDWDDDDDDSPLVPKKRSPRIQVLKGIEIHAKRWFYASAKLEGSVDDRRKMWESCYDPEHHFHLTASGKRQLRGFVSEVAGLLDKVQSSFTTQLSENFHSVKAKMAQKGISWKTSWEARVAVSVL
jgi:hypothetical protein